VGSRSWEESLHIFQGRTFGAPDLTAAAVNSAGRARAIEGKSSQGDRRRQPGFTRGSRRCGAAAVAASFGRKPYGAAAAAHGTPVTGRLRSPPYPAAAPASTTARPSNWRQCACRREKRHQHRAGTPRIVEVGASASPVGLTARARPEARPETRVANLCIG